MKSIEVAEEEA